MASRETQCYIPTKSDKKSPRLQAEKSPLPPSPLSPLAIKLKTPACTFEIATETMENDNEPAAHNNNEFEKFSARLGELEESFSNEKAAIIRNY